MCEYGKNNRKIFIKNNIISLAEYLQSDDWDCYNLWLDEEVQKGYNHKFNETFEEYSQSEYKSLWNAIIILNDSGELIGEIGVSEVNDLQLPDLSIRIFKQYRSRGLGTMAFSMSAKYCFDVLKLDKIYAGCYPDNIKSRKMIEKCCFIPHPEGNVEEKHYITGEPVTQFDFVLTRENWQNL